jgi:Ca2+-binding EF-hand superfamily protein
VSLSGDVNGDGAVGFDDFLVIARNFGQQVDAAFAEGDLTGDGYVGFDDFLVFARGFGWL